MKNISKIPNFSNYLIYKDGNIYSKKKGKFLKKSKDNGYGNYYQTGLVDDDGNLKIMKIHKIVALAFLGEPEKYKTLKGTWKNKEINHIDNNKENNHADNLEYVTHQENIIKSWELGHREECRKILSKTGRTVSEESKNKMSLSKYKKVTILNINDKNDKIIFPSIEEFINIVGIYRKKYNRIKNKKCKNIINYNFNFYKIIF